MIPLPIVYPLWRKLLGALDRWTAAPIMRQRINAGSDVFFAWEEEHEGESELDDVLGVGGASDEDDD